MTRTPIYYRQYNSDGGEVETIGNDFRIATDYEGGVECLAKDLQPGQWILATSPYAYRMPEKYSPYRIRGVSYDLNLGVVLTTEVGHGVGADEQYVVTIDLAPHAPVWVLGSAPFTQKETASVPMPDPVFVLPTVTLAGHSVPSDDVLAKLEWFRNDNAADHDDLIQALPEYGGRMCYQSWDRPNPATATNEGYLHNIQMQSHYSVLEHSSVSLAIEGVSRTLSHEFVRHRHFSYSQLSQRYVDSSAVAFVMPPAFEGDEIAELAFRHDAKLSLNSYEFYQKHQMAKGLTKKQARESARASLLNAAETKFLVTGNLRAWMEFLVKRDNPAADAEIQRLAKMIAIELAELAPAVFSPESRTVWDTSYAQREARA
ncbi:ThyX-like thymidylate synthase [Gordonia phage Skog]|uniref:ThyX-like thymidylate synthase n=1 Tax=Gordonia phage Skog TaxID=2704033 RepID=A0A6G6XK98_9CAUD|nr:thymidylate synthase [Gordonia phage Skog]QIG58275.1 ThyX-like thymidylate synthase [Gordonia phage Skog]